MNAETFGNSLLEILPLVRYQLHGNHEYGLVPNAKHILVRCKEHDDVAVEAIEYKKRHDDLHDGDLCGGLFVIYGLGNVFPTDF